MNLTVWAHFAVSCKQLLYVCSKNLYHWFRSLIFCLFNVQLSEPAVLAFIFVPWRKGYNTCQLANAVCIHRDMELIFCVVTSPSFSLVPFVFLWQHCISLGTEESAWRQGRCCGTITWQKGEEMTTVALACQCSV